MLTLIVMVSRTSRRTLRGLRPSSHSRFGSHPNLIADKIAPFFSSPYVEPILQPFYFHIHACNGGVYPPPQRSDVQICKSKLSCSCGAGIPIRSGRFGVLRSILFVFIFLRTLLRFFARSKNSSLFISSVSALFAKNHPGWGYPLMTRGQNETTHCQFRRSIPSSRTSHYRWSSGYFGWENGKAGADNLKYPGLGCREVAGSRWGLWGCCGSL